MASLAHDPGGKKRISFREANGQKRYSLRLGKRSEAFAKTALDHVEQILFSQRTGQTLPVATAEWLRKLDGELRERLAGVGLVDKPLAGALGPFLENYVAARGDVKPSTATFYGHTKRNLVEFFGAGKLLRDVTIADATKFRQWLKTGQDLEDATIRRRCSLARQFFEFAVDDRLISENPFRKLRGIGVTANRSRDHFVTREDAAKILDACPDVEWAAIFALSRFGGLRCPSEHLRLRWSDVDWSRGRLTIHSPKTERHVGKARRVIPLFPELREPLERAKTPGAEFVINRYRDETQNLRTQFARIVARAGVTPWEKPFQNLRSTRETELAEVFPIHVVCEWIGNSRAVAQKHYLQVTDDHFAAAAKNSVAP